MTQSKRMRYNLANARSYDQAQFFLSMPTSLPQKLYLKSYRNRDEITTQFLRGCTFQTPSMNPYL